MRSITFERFFQKGSDDPFDQLLKLFQELLVYTNGDVAEALDWMNQLDREYNLTNNQYGMGDFIRDLEEKGYLQTQDDLQIMTSRMEQHIRKQALEEIFGKIRKGALGNHQTGTTGRGDEVLPDTRSYQYGDSLDRIALTESLLNMQRRSGDLLNGSMQSDDFVVREREHLTQTSSVLMIDISHSMILYGEDRITPAKKVAMALSEYITTRFPKDTLDIIVFGNDAWQVELKDLPYLEVGPFHTNTVAGIQLARDILRRKKNPNKQILMITDGKPSCLKEHGDYYKNSFGLDRKIVNRTLHEAMLCKRQHIGFTTFMIAQDNYLRQFIAEFTEAAGGKAFYSGLDKLGAFVMHDYLNNKRKRV